MGRTQPRDPADPTQRELWDALFFLRWLRENRRSLYCLTYGDTILWNVSGVNERQFPTPEEAVLHAIEVSPQKPPYKLTLYEGHLVRMAGED